MTEIFSVGRCMGRPNAGTAVRIFNHSTSVKIYGWCVWTFDVVSDKMRIKSKFRSTKLVLHFYWYHFKCRLLSPRHTYMKCVRWIFGFFRLTAPCVDRNWDLMRISSETKSKLQTYRLWIRCELCRISSSERLSDVFPCIRFTANSECS